MISQHFFNVNGKPHNSSSLNLKYSYDNCKIRKIYTSNDQSILILGGIIYNSQPLSYKLPVQN